MDPPGILAGESEVAVTAVRGVFFPFLTTTDHPSPAVAAAFTTATSATAGVVGLAGWAGLAAAAGLVLGGGGLLPGQFLA